MIHRIFGLVARIHGNAKQISEVIAEWHAFVNGWAEGVCPWAPRHKVMAEELADEIKEEYHYYKAGRAIGILTWPIVIGVLVRSLLA